MKKNAASWIEVGMRLDFNPWRIFVGWLVGSFRVNEKSFHEKGVKHFKSHFREELSPVNILTLVLEIRITTYFFDQLFCPKH